MMSRWQTRSQPSPKDHAAIRESQIDFMVNLSSDSYTRETAKAHLEEADRMRMKTGLTRTKLARGEIDFSKAVEVRINGRSNGAPPAIPRGPAPWMLVSPNVQALDIDVVMANKDAFGDEGYDAEKAISYYAAALQRDAATSMERNGHVNFTGSWKDRITNDVNEYVAWLYEAAAATPSAPVSVEKLGELKGKVLATLA